MAGVDELEEQARTVLAYGQEWVAGVLRFLPLRDYPKA